MSYLSDKCTFRMFTPSLVAGGAKFVCGDSDLDEFFHEDAFLQAGQLLCKNYCFTSDENPNEVVCAFTLANNTANGLILRFESANETEMTCQGITVSNIVTYRRVSEYTEKVYK